MSGEEMLGTCVLVLATDQAPLDRGLASSKSKVEKASADMQKSMDKRLSSVSKSMGSVGSSMTKSVTLPVLALGAAAVKMGADFDSAMERVHTQSGASQKEVEALKGQVLALSKVSAQGPTDLANALYRLEGAGYRGAKAMSALKAASELAAVGNANVEDTTKTLTQIMKPGIKGVKDFQDAVAQVNATVGAGDMKLPQLVDALGTGVVTSAKMAGLSLQDVTGALAVFGDETNNVSGWAAQFATALHFITNPTMKASGALESIGLQSNSLALDMQKPNGLVRALRDLQDHLDSTFPKGSGHALTIEQERKALDTYKTTLEQTGVKGGALTKDLDKYRTKLTQYGTAAVAQAQVLGDLFPGGRGRVLSVLLNQVDLLGQKEKQIAGTTGKFGSDVAKTQETTAFKIHNDWAKIQADAVQLGETLGPTFLGIFGAVADEADKIATAFERLPAGTQKAIITGGLITAGIGPALKILSIFTGGIGKLITAEQFAQKLITGKSSLFGSPTTPGQTSASARIASLQVAEMTVGNMIGGGVGAGAGEASAAEGAVAGETRSAGGVILPRGVAAPVAEEIPAVVPSGGAGIGSALKGAAGRAVGGAMVGVTGVAISQIVGTEVKGAVGSAIKEIGTDASIGAGVGAVFGPEGMAGGAIIGGLVGTFKHFFSGKDFGATVAGNVFKGGFGGKQAPDLSKQLAGALDTLHKFTTKTVQSNGPRGSVVTDTVHLDLTKLTGVDQAKALAAANKAGHLVARQLEAGWDQYKFQSEPIMFSQLRSQLKKLPPEAQATALQSAINFSLTLERQGRVAKGSTEKMLKQAESAFPGFTRYLGITATAGINQFTKALDLSNAEKNLKGQLHKMSQDFPQVQKAMADTTGGIQDKATAAVKALKRIQSDGTGPMRRQASRDLDALRSTTAKDLDAMGGEVVAKSKQMRTAIENNTGGAAKTAATNMSNFSTAVVNNINSGAVGAGQGMNILITNLNNALKEMGQKQLSKIQVSSLKLGVGKTQQLTARGAARGTMIQFGEHGQRGHDSIPVNFGGVPVVVAPGEQGLVLTNEQQAFLNSRTSDVGGLHGMFRKLRRPQYMAGGGFVADPGTIQNVGDLPQITSRLGALGRALNVIIYGISGYRSPAHSVAVGGFSDDPHTQGKAEDIGVNARTRSSAAQLSRAILAKYGLDRPFDESDDPSNSEVNHIQLLAGAVGAAIAGASTGTGGGVPQISAPKVTGSGVMATLAKAALGKGTAGANAYLGKFAGSIAGAGGAVPPGTVRDWLTKALKITGHLTPANLSALFGRTMQESNGNPRAINLSDSNAKAGHPSEGLLQTIMPTFQKYEMQGHGDIWNPVDNAIAAIRYMFGTYGHIVGPSGSGYAQGGIIPGFAKGGAPAQKLGTGMKAFTARTAKRAKPKHGVAKPKGAKPLGAALKIPGSGDQDVAVINRELGNLNALTGDSGDVARLGELLSYWPNEWSISNPLLGQDASSFVVTTDALGNSVTPYLDTAGVNLSAGELQQELGWETGTVGDLRTALQMVRQIMPLIKAAIRKRQAALAALKKQIRDNLAKIALLRQNITDLGNDPAVVDLRKQINSAGTTPQSLTSLKQQLANAEKIEVPSGKKGDARRAARDGLIGSLQGKIYAAERGQKVTVTDLRNKLIDVESDDKQKKSGYESQITGLETLNQQLGGDKTAVGTAGKIGPLNTQISNLNDSLSTVSGDPGTIAGASGVGGELGPALIQEDTLRAEIAQLGSGPLGQALAAAGAASGASTAGATTDDSAMVGLLQQQLQQSALALSVSQSQYGVLSGAIGSLPKFGGSFSTGGMVPGVMGEPRMILAHGKEEVLTAQQAAERQKAEGTVPHAIFTLGPGVEQLIDSRIAYVNSSTVATARRRLPGRPGVNR